MTELHEAIAHPCVRTLAGALHRTKSLTEETFRGELLRGLRGGDIPQDVFKTLRESTWREIMGVLQYLFDATEVGEIVDRGYEGVDSAIRLLQQREGIAVNPSQIIITRAAYDQILAQLQIARSALGRVRLEGSSQR